MRGVHILYWGVYDNLRGCWWRWMIYTITASWRCVGKQWAIIDTNDEPLITCIYIWAPYTGRYIHIFTFVANYNCIPLYVFNDFVNMYIHICRYCCVSTCTSLVSNIEAQYNNIHLHLLVVFLCKVRDKSPMTCASFATGTPCYHDNLSVTVSWIPWRTSKDFHHLWKATSSDVRLDYNKIIQHVTSMKNIAASFVSIECMWTTS